jgi:hypothetical protein
MRGIAAPTAQHSDPGTLRNTRAGECSVRSLLHELTMWSFGQLPIAGSRCHRCARSKRVTTERRLIAARPIEAHFFRPCM